MFCPSCSPASPSRLFRKEVLELQVHIMVQGFTVPFKPSRSCSFRTCPSCSSPLLHHRHLIHLPDTSGMRCSESETLTPLFPLPLSASPETHQYLHFRNQGKTTGREFVRCHRILRTRFMFEVFVVRGVRARACIRKSVHISFC